METTMVAYLQSQGSGACIVFMESSRLRLQKLQVCLEGHVDLVSSTWASRDPSMAHGAINVLLFPTNLVSITHTTVGPWGCMCVCVCVWGEPPEAEL